MVSYDYRVRIDLFAMIEVDQKEVEDAEWQFGSDIRSFKGFAYGSRYPSIVFKVEVPALNGEIRSRVARKIVELVPDLGASDLASESCGEESWQDTVDWLLTILTSYQISVGLPVYEPARVLRAHEPIAELQVPSCDESLGVLSAMLRCTIALIPFLIIGKSNSSLQDELLRLFASLRASGFGSSNVPRFIRAAFDLGIPFRELPGKFVQYGEGFSACWLDSTFTEQTSCIAAKVAKAKVLTSAMLRQAGLPVPTHYSVSTSEEAVRSAARLGYPVVIKPANLDGGVGVAAGLHTAAEVADAFMNARKFSHEILVEEHVEGSDYRLTVFRDEMIWAVERVPGGVTGDGHSTVAALLDKVNTDPRRGDSRHSPLKRLKLDDEAKSLLRQYDLSLTSVPNEGQFVRLRRVANVASGGMPVAVFDRVHPDNAQLAVRAARALHLDLAGVDLIIPDISISWLETGAAICEVNAKPQIGGTTAAHVYPQILKNLVQGSGRVTTIIVMGADPHNNIVNDLGASLCKEGIVVGVHDHRGVRVDCDFLLRGSCGIHAAGTILTLDRRVQVQILTIQDAECLVSAMPVQRINVLILAGNHLNHAETTGGLEKPMVVDEILRMITPSCDEVISHEPGQPIQSLARRVAGAVQANCPGGLGVARSLE